MKSPLAIGTFILLCLFAQAKVAHAGQQLIDIPGRAGSKVPVLELTREGKVDQVVIALAGGSGQRGLHYLSMDDLPTDPETPLGAWRYLAQRVGAVVLVDTPEDHPVLDMEDRRRADHRQDIAAVIDAMRLRHPKARIVLAGSSNGAYSVGFLSNSLSKQVDAAILISGTTDAWVEMTHVEKPVLAVHHKRDACLLYKDSYPKMRFYPLITVDDPNQPLPDRYKQRDCGPQSAHALHGRRAATFAAIADWLVDGTLREKVD